MCGPGPVRACGTKERDVREVRTVEVLGVRYEHFALANGDDLYLTEYGRQFSQLLLPENYWTDVEWFRGNSEKLNVGRYHGTSTAYRISTKPVEGHSLDIMLKWNRMGQDIPGEEEDIILAEAAFNSPFEEFALVAEVGRAGQQGGVQLRTHHPLAIYVPFKRTEFDRTGRREFRMKALARRHAGVELDMRRLYAVIYHWVDGVDALEAQSLEAISEDETVGLVMRAEREMAVNGFRMLDLKPAHIILSIREDGTAFRGGQGRIPYTLVDFELLGRTPEREAGVKDSRRNWYLVHQAHRFDDGHRAEYPPHLQGHQVFGVDYVHGQVHSTNGALWVVGKDPTLFDYFLPERWRQTPRTKLSVVSRTFHTTTRDNIQLVWKVSPVGERPDMDPFDEREHKILEYGYNSPFEEVALALKLAESGIKTTYPRAVYMTGHDSEMHEHLRDGSRYESHQDVTGPDGRPVLRRDRDYVTLWGYWNGPDEALAEEDSNHYRAIDALRAFRESIIAENLYLALMRHTKSQLAKLGVEDLNLRGSHLLLSIDQSGNLVVGTEGLPEFRICNFELLRRPAELLPT